MSYVRRRIGGVLVVVGHNQHGEPVGSRLVHRGRVWHLPHWPSRIRDVAVLDDGDLSVTFATGGTRLLTTEDADELRRR